jgi:hypothetical protein
MVKKLVPPLKGANATQVRNPKTWRQRISMFNRLGHNASGSNHSIPRRLMFDRIQMNLNRVEKAKNMGYQCFQIFQRPPGNSDRINQSTRNLNLNQGNRPAMNRLKIQKEYLLRCHWWAPIFLSVVLQISHWRSH